VLHGTFSYLLQDMNGQVSLAHSISAGLDYPGVGPEHSFLKTSKRVLYAAVSDIQALRAAELLSQTEGIIPALESAHAVAYLETLMPKTRKNDSVIICLSGRGDKDMQTYMKNISKEGTRP
jgi:tryptophan synthase beta chain